MNNKYIIECTGVRKAFGHKLILREINLQVERGSIVAITGSNGAGKTTLLKILAHLIIPSAGSILIEGQDVSAWGGGAKRMVGFVSSEERSFYWRLSGKENLKFFGALYNIHGKECDKRIHDILSILDPSIDKNRPFREYSSGMKQIFCIARGLIHDPPILLLDEPTKSLSTERTESIHALLLKKAKDQGNTIIIATHDLKEVEAIADDVRIIDRGTMRMIGKNIPPFESAS